MPPRFEPILPRLALAGALLATALIGVGAAPRSLRHAPPAPGTLRAATARPSPGPSAIFVANRGQLPAGVRYAAAGHGLQVTLGVDGVTFTRPGRAERRAARPYGPSWRASAAEVGAGWSLPGASTSAGARVADETADEPAEVARLTFVGARRDVVPEGREALATRVSYFKGPRARWITDVPTYARVVYPDLWPGIDLELRGTPDGVAYGFVVAPGADPGAVRPVWQGSEAVRRAVEGEGAGAFQAPGSVAAPAEAGTNAAYTVYAGFFGGAGYDRGLGIAVDGDNGAYICGETTDPATQDTDAYVAKVRPDGGAYAYIAIVGGDAYDAAFDVAVDDAGNAYFTGVAMSDEASFPVTMGPDLTHNGVIDTAVVKIAPDGDDLVYAGFLGGELTDFGEGIRVGDDGSVYLHGIAMSTEATFPVKVGPDLTFNGEDDAFVAKVKPVPDAADVRDNLVYSGYIGGDRSDITLIQDGTYSTVSSGHIGIDDQGALYVSGETTSEPTTFPDGDGFGALPGADQTYAGGWDAYVAKVAPDGARLEYATYVGGDGLDLGKGMTVDAAGSAYFTGYTGSTEATMPVTVGPDLTFNGGDMDALVGKLTPDGRAFAYLGFLGGDDTDVGEAVAVDAEGRLHVVGYTESGAGSFPAKGGPDLTQNDLEEGAGDAFLARIVADPSAAAAVDNVEFAGYIGGGGEDQAYWVALDGAGDIHVAGDTSSGPDTFPDGQGLAGLPGPNAVAGGDSDGFVISIRVGDAPPRATPSPTSTATPPDGGQTHRLYLPAALSTAALVEGGDGIAAAAPRMPARAAQAGIPSLPALRAESWAPRRQQAPAQSAPTTRSWDDFCDFVAGWAWEDSDETEAHVRVDNADGTCDYLMVQRAQGAYATTSNVHVATGDFRVETLVAMHGEGGSAGLLFGIPGNASRFTIFAVTNPGRYVVARYAGGLTTILQRGDAVFDAAAPVMLAADVRADGFDLLVNDERVGTVDDTAPHDGRVGLYTEWNGIGDEPFWNSFDWIRIAEAGAP